MAFCFFFFFLISYRVISYLGTFAEMPTSATTNFQFVLICPDFGPAFLPSP